MLQGQIQNLILPDRDPEGEKKDQETKKKVPDKDEDERKGMQIWEGEKSRGHKLCVKDKKVVAKREATKEKDANKCIREFKSKP